MKVTCGSPSSYGSFDVEYKFDDVTINQSYDTGDCADIIDQLCDLISNLGVFLRIQAEKEHTRRLAAERKGK